MVDPLLSDLCRICHVNSHKYRCPRCSTLTCSLACVKRHKKRAQCSGIRDPAAYLKRNELATPSGIDKDYNFLTSIERRIDNAERDADGRGVVLRDVDSRNWREKGLNGPMKGETQMQAAIESCKVVIDRAPKGMARAKQNKTKWYKKQRYLCWTVEWVHNDGRKDLGECLESQSISEAYAAQFDITEPSKKKRRKSPFKVDSATAAGGSILSTDVSACRASFDSSVPSACSVPLERSSGIAVSNSQPVALPIPSVSSELPAPITADPIPSEPCVNQSATYVHSVPPTPSLNFYLHLPSTPTSARVLIPLPPYSTLSTSLSHRLVLEFPTIYALHNPPDELPEGFMVEEEYLKGIGRGGVKSDLNGLIEEVANGVVGESGVEEGGKDGMDEKRLADVLKRDLGGRII